MSKAIQNSDDEETNRSPAQIIPRHVDTAMKVNGYPVKKFVIGFLPAGICALAGVLTVLMSGPALLAGVFVLVFAPVALVLGGWVVIKSNWHTPPRERLRNWRRYRRLRRSMLWNHSETVAHDLAGLAEIYDDGTARMTDGRVVGLADISGRATDRMTEFDANEIVNQLGGQFDETIKNFGFRFYTTTLHTSDTDALTKSYHEAARSERLEDRVWTYVRAICRSLAQWRSTTDDPAWDAPDRRHYIVVEATDDDARSLPSPSIRARLNPFHSSEDVTERQRRRAAKRELLSRLSNVEGAISNVEGLSAERISPDEHAQILLDYWTGENHAPDDELEHAFRREHTGPTVWPPARTQSTPDSDVPMPGDEREDAAGVTQGEDGDSDNDQEGETMRAPGNRTARERLFGLFDGVASSDEASGADHVGLSSEDETPAQRLLAPGIYDVTRDYVRVGDQLCRTYWISEWPDEPDSLYWKPIYTLFGAELDGGDLNPETDIPVDLDVSIHVEPEDRDAVMKELSKQWGSIGAEGVQRSEGGGDVTAIGVDSDQDIYTQMYELLRTTNVQPWRVSAYVTVRAGQKQAIEQFEDTLRDYASLDAAKQDALRVRSEQITDMLEAAPTNCYPVMAGDLHHAAFESGSPTGRNAFAQIGRRDLKTQWMLGDGVAALFPPCSDTIQEEEGIEWGRNEQDGQVIKANPFERGLAPHIITIGTSRSGKSYSAQKACQRWYSEGKDRTLIVLDTQGEFDGLTKALNGKHIVLGGRDAVNPFHTEAPPEHAGHTGGQMSPFTMKADSIVQFIKALVRTQGYDPSIFHNTIEQLVRRTLIEAGADPRDPSSLADADATMRDFIELSEKVMDEPSSLTLGTHDKELGKKAEKIAELRDALGGFMEGQKYEYLLDEDATGLMDDDVDMAYLDLRQFRDSSSAEKSAMFRLMLDQVNQKVKRTSGETIFLIDEAHFLLHSEEMVNWLQKAAREWARYDACLWFCSQSPREFIAQTTGDDGENKRRTIYEQCSTVQFFRTRGLDTDDEEDDILPKFGLNERQVKHVKKGMHPGKEGDYSQALIQFDDRPESWFPLHIEASPVEDAICTYTPREDGDFAAYMEAQCGIEPPEESGYTPPATAVPVVPDPAEDDEESSPVATTTPTATADGGTLTGPVGNSTNESGIDARRATDTDAAHDLLTVDPSTLGERSGSTNHSRTSVEQTEAASHDDNADGNNAPDAGNGTDSETYEGSDWVDDAALYDVHAESEREDKDMAPTGTTTAATPASTPNATESAETSDARTREGLDTETESEQDPSSDESASDGGLSESCEEEDAAVEEPNRETEVSRRGLLSRFRGSISSAFDHPATEKSQLDVTDIGIVDAEKATVLREAGFETVTEVYTAESTALTTVEDIDETNATYIQDGAEQALEASAVSMPADAGKVHTEDAHGSETNGTSEQSVEEAQPPDVSDGDESADAAEQTSESTDNQPVLTDLQQVGDNRADEIHRAGLKTVQDVATADQNALTNVEGIGEARAETIAESANTLISDQSDGGVADAGGDG
ncbi:helix-hairpin-helix domain-containing protein [Halococcus sediminicola]|uniref:helix-hairpin-helix domain-containing protein n=1 Tax=Halococcus sediminicola TaxID=1264579 RepID=UPI000678C0DB|nr:helix-hairpin-helix domain-containing protein [Halococcus sediminicola]